MTKKIDKVWATILIISVILSILAFLFKTELFNILKIVFNIDNLSSILGSAAALISVVHKLKFKKISFKSTMTFSQFREPFEAITSFISNPISVLCSFSILKGLFLQQFDKQAYFPKFDTVEVGFLWLIAAYLLYNSVSDSVKEFLDVLFESELVIEPEPISKTEYDSSEK